MKKFILILLIISIVPIYSEAKNLLPEKINAVETSIFGYDYQGESDSKRIERIESYLYGQKKNGNLQKRLEDIQSDIGFVDPKIQQNQSDINQNLKNTDSSLPSSKKLKEDSSVNYPIVDKMEQEIFKTTYKNEDIYKRLDRLETQVFTKTSNSPLDERVDKLSAIIIPQKSRPKFNNFRYSTEDLDEYYSTSGLEPIDDDSMPFQLAVLEEDLLRGNYQTDNTSNRLTRLEKKLFKKTFENDTDISRLQRIMVAYDAKKNSYKYDNNKTMQNMATISQIGGILLMILAILL